jgi:hypothetical protein
VTKSSPEKGHAPPDDADLPRIAELWPRLPDALKAAVLPMIQAALPAQT